MQEALSIGLHSPFVSPILTSDFKKTKLTSPVAVIAVLSQLRTPIRYNYMA